MSSQTEERKAELESLLGPIPGASPTGSSLRYDGSYDRIQRARKGDDPTLSQGVWKTALKRADWQDVEELCLSDLRTRSKDLQIAAWLMEAWLHLHRFAGVADGLELLKELVDRYWEGLHPHIEGDDLEYRTAPITWINEKLSIQLKLLPITAPGKDEAPSYCWSDWENACRIETSDAKARASGRLTLPEFQRSVMLTPTEFLTQTGAEVERAMEACSALESVLDRHCGKSGPSLRQFWNAMESVRALMANWLAQRPPSQPPPHDTGYSPVAALQQPDDDQVMWTQSNSIQSRDEAYQRLSEAADYLAQTEPHSPTPYLVKRAIAWGSLKLPELLQELVRSEGELAEIFRLLQVEKTNPGK